MYIYIVAESIPVRISLFYAEGRKDEETFFVTPFQTLQKLGRRNIFGNRPLCEVAYMSFS
jgi:hypothetical protein